MSLAIPLQLDNATAQELVTFYALKVFRLEMGLAAAEMRLQQMAAELIDAKKALASAQPPQADEAQVQWQSVAELKKRAQAESYGGSAA